MKVFRFINPQGNGLYHDEFNELVGLPMNYEDIPPHQPPVTEDVKGLKYSDLDKIHCAFKDMNQLISWFRYQNPLEVFINGGKLIEVEIPQNALYMGSHQCAYLQKSVVSVKEIDIDKFIEISENAINNFKNCITW